MNPFRAIRLSRLPVGTAFIAALIFAFACAWPAAAAPINGIGSAAPREIAFVDSRVPDLRTLLHGVKPGGQVVVLDPNCDGIQQIADTLAQSLRCPPKSWPWRKRSPR